jgi:hypothetical protein
MEAGQQSEEGVSMGSAAVIFVLLVVVAIQAIGWSATAKKNVQLEKLMLDCIGGRDVTISVANDRNAQLEAEIQRLRKIPLTQPPEKVDNSTIKAKSSADVRRLTEAAFGLQPEIGEQNDIE